MPEPKRQMIVETGLDFEQISACEQSPLKASMDEDPLNPPGNTSFEHYERFGR